ncbi:MAG: hypothetical protein WC489_06170 [Patescibacteria group bacterium]|jgi:hypothetical protein
MKFSKHLKNGWKCGECGNVCGTDQGGSEAYKNGMIHMSCPYCGKVTKLDHKHDPNNWGRLIRIKR